MKFTVVIVTYNRLDKLKKALKAYDNQKKIPDAIIVVDNASSDGTKDYLLDWYKTGKIITKKIITNDENLGGSYGFYIGLKEAINIGNDWIWVSDDDAYPHPESLARAEKFLDSRNTDNISAICGSVWHNGKIDIGHRKRFTQKGMQIIIEPVKKFEYNNETFELNGFSYVGTIISKNKLLQAGLPKKDYFIWFDDSEHSIRMSKFGSIICVPEIQIEHDVDSITSDILSWKTYYGTRNRADMIKSNFSYKAYLYFVINLYIRQIGKLFIGKERESIKIIIKALNDCRKRNFGIDNLYKPGWRPINGK